MKKKPLIKLSVFFTLFLFFSCGIEQYYYLSQVPEGNIVTSSNTLATVTIPPVPSDQYYASHYTIYYRIYISDQPTDSREPEHIMNPVLLAHYEQIFPHTNPANQAATTSVTVLFENRNYFKLEFAEVSIDSVLTVSGGTLTLDFIETVPFAQMNTNQYTINRSGDFILQLQPPNDRRFRNTPELNAPDNSNININRDVQGLGRDPILPSRHAYVSMYIVTVGSNPVNLTPVYSRPTHIGIFKLPDVL